jgi:hypothetical protein
LREGFPLQSLFKALSGATQSKFDHKNPMMTVLCASILSKVINLNPLQPDEVMQLLNCLCQLKDVPDE